MCCSIGCKCELSIDWDYLAVETALLAAFVCGAIYVGNWLGMPPYFCYLIYLLSSSKTVGPTGFDSFMKGFNFASFMLSDARFSNPFALLAHR